MPLTLALVSPVVSAAKALAALVSWIFRIFKTKKKQVIFYSKRKGPKRNVGATVALFVILNGDSIPVDRIGKDHFILVETWVGYTVIVRGLQTDDELMRFVVPKFTDNEPITFYI